MPRLYSSEKIAEEKNKKWGWRHRWYLAYRYISSSTNERCVIASVIPASVVSNSAYLIFISDGDELLLQLGNMNSFCFDFAVRAKVTMNLPPVILQQTPGIGKRHMAPSVFEAIKERVLALTYTAHDLDPFGRDYGLSRPFTWNSEERFRMQCGLDAIYAHLYGLNKEELAFILDSFTIVKRRDEERYGCYRTRETTLALHDKFAWVEKERVTVKYGG